MSEAYDTEPNTVELPVDSISRSPDGCWKVTCRFCDEVCTNEYKEIAVFKFKEHARKKHLFPGSGLYMNSMEYAERQRMRDEYRAIMGTADDVRNMNREGL